MERMIAFCALECSTCPGYIVAQDDDEAYAKITVEWFKAYNADIKPTYVNCNGCTDMEGRHTGYCAVCGVRKCASARGVTNCAYCDDYACETLSNFHKMAPRAKENLEEIRKTLNRG